MSRIAVVLVVLLSTEAAWAQAPVAAPVVTTTRDAAPVGDAEADEPMTAVEIEARRGWLSQPHLGARRELRAGLWLSVASSSLVLLGGVFIGAAAHSPTTSGMFAGGLSLTMTGAALTYPTLLTLLYGAGHNYALDLVERDGNVERVAAYGKRCEYAGIGLFAAGWALFAAGIGMAIGSISPSDFDYGGSGNSNASLYWAGWAVASIGEASVFSGSLAWTYGGGVMRGVRQARRGLHASAGGIGGTF